MNSPDSLPRLALLAARTSQALAAEADRLTAWWGLTAAQWQVLDAIARAGRPLSAAATARCLAMTRQAASKQIGQLVARGFLDRHDDPADARAPVHALSAEGWATFDAVSTAWATRCGEIAGSFTGPEIAAACTLLESLLARLQPAAPANSPASLAA